MDDSKSFPAEYTDQVLRILKEMSFGNKVKLRGTSSLRSGLYASDYDGFEEVRRNGTKENVLRKLKTDFQAIIKNLRGRKDIFIGDIKAGVIPEWDILGDTKLVDGGVKDYNHIKSRQRIDELVANRVLTPQEGREAYALTPETLTPADYAAAREGLKYHIVRWTAPEVLIGRRDLPGGKTFTLEDAFSSPGITKLDTVAFLSGNRFVEMSIIYEFFNKGKALNGAPGDLEESIKEHIYIYFIAENYFKMLKRILSLARLTKKESIIKQYLPIVNGDLGRMSLVVNDIDILLYLFATYKNLPESSIRFEVDQFIQRLSNVYATPRFNKIRWGVFSSLHRIVKLPLSKMPAALEKVSDELNALVQDEVKKALFSGKE